MYTPRQKYERINWNATRLTPELSMGKKDLVAYHTGKQRPLQPFKYGGCNEIFKTKDLQLILKLRLPVPHTKDYYL